ncbi:L-lactate permease, putative [Thermodesulfobium narugense DSM 14796]|uniref:L-lactate permease n=2 Tax=Thermodesulfobium narugense TaxID=184064 RepID=M1E8W4_9BACT|nr:L-lactate permease, putative [Thermodesulfobium narugense DSM 14796]
MDFLLAISPIVLILLGMTIFSRSGFLMSVLAWIFTFLLALVFFKTPFDVCLSATIFGILKSLSISLAVFFTMLLIFIMKATKALDSIAYKLKNLCKTKEEQVMFLGLGFGSLATSLGVVTPALFPPLLLTLGFSPVSSIAISVLCYDPLTSFALLSIPITVPSEVAWQAFKIQPQGITNLEHFINTFTIDISIFLPFISVGFAYIMLYFIDGINSLKRGFISALLSGLVLGFSCLTFSITKIFPVQIIGTLSGLLTMIFVLIYQRITNVQNPIEEKGKPNMSLLRATSPWILLFFFALVTNLPGTSKFLSDLPGKYEVITLYKNQSVDLNILSSIWFWIMITTIISIFLLRPTNEQLSSTIKLWLKRSFSPFVAYSVCFSIAMIMAWSAMSNSSGVLVPGAYYSSFNMDRIIAIKIAMLSGTVFTTLIPYLGLIGSFIGGSETASNVFFAKILYESVKSVGYDSYFMIIFGAHAVAGGIASAITPAKITNAAMTIGCSGKEESEFMKKAILPVIILTFLTGIILTVFISLGIK